MVPVPAITRSLTDKLSDRHSKHRRYKCPFTEKVSVIFPDKKKKCFLLGLLEGNFCRMEVRTNFLCCNKYLYFDLICNNDFLNEFQ